MVRKHREKYQLITNKLTFVKFLDVGVLGIRKDGEVSIFDQNRAFELSSDLKSDCTVNFLPLHRYL